MKKGILFLLCIFVIFFAGCKEESSQNLEPNNPKPGNPVQETPDEQERGSIEDYYPLFADKTYIYSGEGNEYASYSVYADYLDDQGNKMQTRTNNGGTEIIDVIQIKDGNLSILLSREEAYYRDNLLKKTEENDTEILLKEPLVKGTKWALPDGRNRSITDTEATLTTPLGEYANVIEVTTEGNDSTVKDYYAKGVGLIKTVFESEGNTVTSTLTEIKEKASYEKSFQVFYPGEDEKLHIQDLALTFKTNDITRLKLEAALKEQLPNDTRSLISTNTKINSLYLGKDHIAYVDFSKEFVSEMNAGAMFESLILQGVANTIGNYYGVEKVCLTIEDQPYESGHILLEKGELLTVDMKNVAN